MYIAKIPPFAYLNYYTISERAVNVTLCFLSGLVITDSSQRVSWDRLYDADRMENGTKLKALAWFNHSISLVHIAHSLIFMNGSTHMLLKHSVLHHNKLADKREIKKQINEWVIGEGPKTWRICIPVTKSRNIQYSWPSARPVTMAHLWIAGH